MAVVYEENGGESPGETLQSVQDHDGVGDDAGFVLSAKKLADLASQSVPQAALPRVGVCGRLQAAVVLRTVLVLGSYPSNPVKSNISLFSFFCSFFFGLIIDSTSRKIQFCLYCLHWLGLTSLERRITA